MIARTPKQLVSHKANQRQKAERFEAILLTRSAVPRVDKKFMFLTRWRQFSVPSWPEPQEEYKFNSPESKHAFDWAWPLYQVAVEVDGGQHAPGGGRHAKDSDKLKGNLAAARGWLVFHFSPQMLERDPEVCVRQVQETILLRSKSRE